MKHGFVNKPAANFAYKKSRGELIILKRRFRIIQITLISLLSFILLLNLVLPTNTIAGGNHDERLPMSAIGITSETNKINSKVAKQFQEQDKVTFLLKLKDQVDTNQVAMAAAEKAKKLKQTAASTELQVRSAIVSSLRNKATETQAELMDFLEQSKLEGNVSNIQSFYIVNAIAVTATEEVMEKLAKYPEVAKVLPNETRQLFAPITPKGIPSNETSSTVEWGVKRVGAPQVWDMGIDGSGIVVASIDTGVQWDHPALKEKYRGYNSMQPNQPDHQVNWFDAIDGEEAPYDDLKHGTHTVGTILGSEPDGSNQIGVAPGAKWIAVKAFSEAGGKDIDLLEAGEWILAPKDAEGNPHPELAPDIVNNSWGGGSSLDEWYLPMVQNWRSANIFPVFAAGNSGSDEGTISNPANYPESFAVAATDDQNSLAWFSSRGPSPYDDIKPDVSAPGVSIRSAVPTNDYELMSGTSMATPHIAGVVALVKQANSSLTIDQIEKVLMDTAIPLTSSVYPASPNYGFGHGFVNAYNAIKSVNAGTGVIQGEVVHDGKDATKPTYQHTSLEYVYDQVVLPLTIEVQDNISVASVEIQYLADQDWKTIKAERTAGDFRNGTYQAVVPGEDIRENLFTYKWRIEDYGKNEVITSNYEIEVKPAITTGYSHDFESVPEGWYSEGINNDWEWGAPVDRPDKAYSGQKVYGTNVDGSHAFNSSSLLHMPPIDLPDGKNAYLQFKQWYDFSPDGVVESTDFGAVLVSLDGENWERLYRTEPSKYHHEIPIEYTTEDWIDGEVDLTAYAGKRIYISFYMNAVQTGFETREYSGWYVDNVELSERSYKTGGEQKTFGKNQNTEVHLKENVGSNVLAPSATFVENTIIQSNVLPILGKVTLLDSGYSVATNPADGSYIMMHNTGDFTIRAEAYGFHPKEQPVSIPEDGIVQADFNLKPLAYGTIEGVVKDKATGKPLMNAVLSLVEDASITPVKTDSKGRFTLTAFEGSYTLHAFKNNYLYNELSVTISPKKKTRKNIELKRYIGFPGEIGYDDGTGENSWFWRGANNGFGIRMSLEEGITKSWVTGGLFKVNTNFPSEGSTRFQVAVYDSSGPNGAPGKRIAGPINADARTDGEWTHVDLTDKNIFVTGDFYLVYIQPDASSAGTSPSLYSDHDGPFHDRNWDLFNGKWTNNQEPEYGNMMIRAIVNNEIPAPVIETPLDNTFTNEATVQVKGTAFSSHTVKIQNNGKEAVSGASQKDGTFHLPLKLKDGRNRITATGWTKDGSTDVSSPVNIILDEKNPIIKDVKVKGKQEEGQSVTIQGTVKDEYLEEVLLQGEEVEVDSKGNFHHQVKLKKGINTIIVQAADKADNTASKIITIKAK
ncbi:S8 family serine peptidase [Cytobacillus firmus]|uniref:S8 family peptidase n=1 Tax=Cytobacillus firmus TaxID=1399 RepID=UPI0021892D8A|nr:S8 family peptidase [Cytobacillus firmus]URM34813.1 S8 family serine peptidase [Cytobacillus firmus]